MRDYFSPTTFEPRRHENGRVLRDQRLQGTGQQRSQPFYIVELCFPTVSLADFGPEVFPPLHGHRSCRDEHHHVNPMLPCRDPVAVLPEFRLPVVPDAVREHPDRPCPSVDVQRISPAVPCSSQRFNPGELRAGHHVCRQPLELCVVGEPFEAIDNRVRRHGYVTPRYAPAIPGDSSCTGPAALRGRPPAPCRRTSCNTPARFRQRRLPAGLGGIEGVDMIKSPIVARTAGRFREPRRQEAGFPAHVERSHTLLAAPKPFRRLSLVPAGVEKAAFLQHHRAPARGSPNAPVQTGFQNTQRATVAASRPCARPNSIHL